MLMLKSCARCKVGDVYLDQDDGRHCLQCGHVQYSPGLAFGGTRMARLIQTHGGKGSASGQGALGQVQAVAS